ncbi:patatin family protein [soil metagenome]
MLPNLVTGVDMRNAIAAICLSAMALAGCQTLDRPVFTYAQLASASPDIRMDFVGGDDRDRYVAAMDGAVAAARDGTFDLLALSGGGADGAYGAGVLVGWSEHGDRPMFEVVTGVSTGALMAPFAFIGPQGDAELTQAFTDGRSDNLLEARWAMALVGPGVFRQRPLRALVAASIDQSLLDRVAQGHREGRRFYVATTSLDTQGQVIWDMGALAASGDPGALDLFIDILTASASIPGVFPPVFIDIGSGSDRVRELHADGRTTANFFVAPERLMLDPRLLVAQGEGPPRRLWIGINGRPEARFSPATFSGVGVAGRGLDTMMKASTRMNLVASAQFARIHAMDLRVTMAPGGENSLSFDRARMRDLFEQGRSGAASGSAWQAYDADARIR